MGYRNWMIVALIGGPPALAVLGVWLQRWLARRQAEVVAILDDHATHFDQMTG